MFVIAIFVSQLSGFDGYRPKLEFFRVYMQFQTLNKRVQKSFREENENAQKIILNRRKPNLFFFQNQNLMENTEALQLVMVEQKKSKWSTEVNQRKTKLKCDDCWSFLKRNQSIILSNNSALLSNDASHLVQKKDCNMHSFEPIFDVLNVSKPTAARLKSSQSHKIPPNSSAHSSDISDFQKNQSFHDLNWPNILQQCQRYYAPASRIKPTQSIIQKEKTSNANRFLHFTQATQCYQNK
jgi:hypothetical protein